MIEHLDSPKEYILKEGISRDTLSNFYYLKNLIFIPYNFKKLLFVTPEFRIPRLKLVGRKVLGQEYDITFVSVPFKPSDAYKNEDLTLQLQADFLDSMPDGDDGWLKDKFYTAPYYRYWQEKSKTEKDPEQRLII